MTTYVSDRKFSQSDAELSIKLSSEHPFSFSDYGQILEDLDTIFGFCSKELTARVKTASSNQKKKNAMLVAKEFKSGSLEIFANPYFQGTVGSLLASGIVAVFVHVCQRINGKPESETDDMLSKVDKDVVSEEKIKEAASKAVQRTATARKRISEKTKSFGLEIKITFKGKSHDIL